MTDPLKLLLGAAMDTSGGFVDEGVGLYTAVRGGCR
jgi:hypothetical protein